MNKYKLIVFALMLSCAGIVSAQEDKESQNPKHSFELPKAGDIGLGIDVAPMFQYIGNLFNGTQGNTFDAFGGEYGLDVLDDNLINKPTVSIMGKYMITDHIAARLNVGVLVLHENNQNYAPDDAALFDNPTSEAEVIDKQIINASGASFTLGAEYRRGYKWIQGIAGANLIYAFSENNVRYNWGNALTEINQTPTRTNNWTSVAMTPPPSPDYWTQAYVLKHYNQASNQYFGIGAHVGVECFLTSYLALGGEVYLNALWKWGAPEYMITEGFNTLNNKVEQRTETVSPGNNAFTLGTQNLGGKLYLMFYF